MDKYNLPIPPSGMIDQKHPDNTLFNVLNTLEVMRDVIINEETSCADRGRSLLLGECVKALSYEANRIHEMVCDIEATEKQEISHG